jgi:hypothetical protein
MGLMPRNADPLMEKPSDLGLEWGPQMTLLPHNHLMRVVIGIYTGREDNIFWRRVPGAEGGKIETVGVRCLGAGRGLPPYARAHNARA